MATIDNLDIQIKAQTSKANTELDKLFKKLVDVESALAGVANGYDDAAQAITRFSRGVSLIGTVSGKTNVNIRATATSTRQLNSATGKTHQSLARMSSVLKGVGNTLKSTTSAAMKLSSAFGRLVAAQVPGLSMLTKGSRGVNQLGLSFGNLLRAIIPFYGIRGVFDWIKDSVGYASDLTEIQNVVDVTFGNMRDTMEKFAKTSIEDYGMGPLTAKSIASRFQAMGVAMGIQNSAAKKAGSELSSMGIKMSDAYEKGAESVADMSVQLTKLAADIASFYDKDYETVAKSMEAIYTGQTRPLRQYGIDLTQATLSEWAATQGLNANMQAMTQAEKTLLRYQYVLAHTTAAQGDFQRTSQNWANQLRILRQNLQMLGSTLGGVVINAFRPVLVWLNAFVGKVTAVVETIANALGKIFGWTIQRTSSGVGGDDIEGAADAFDDVAGGADDAAGSIGKANKAAKEFKATVLGFDELNKLNDNTTPDTGTGGSGGSGGGGGGGTGAGAAGASDFAIVKTKSIFEQYTSDINNLYQLGEYIGNVLADALGDIKWEKVYRKARNFGTGLALFLNGLISPELFGTLGSTIAGSINTALNGLNSFGTHFDWKDFGTSLGTGVRNFFLDYDWKLSADTFVTFSNGIFTALNSALDEIPFKTIGINLKLKMLRKLQGFDWDLAFTVFNKFGTKLGSFLNGLIDPTIFGELGEAIANAMNAAIEGANGLLGQLKKSQVGKSIASAINSFFGTFEFEDLVTAINTFADVVLTQVGDALANTNWGQIGEKIGTALRSIKWKFHFRGIADVLGGAINAVIEVAKGIIDPTGLGTPLTEALDGIKEAAQKFKEAVDWNALTTSIRNLVNALKPIGRGFAKGLVDAFTKLGAIGADVLNAIGKTFDAISNFLNNLPDGVLEKVGTLLGQATVMFGAMKAAKSAMTVFKGLATVMGGGAVATGGASAGATAAGSAIGGFSLSRIAGKVGTKIGNAGTAFLGADFASRLVSAISHGISTGDWLSGYEKGGIVDTSIGTQKGRGMQSLANQYWEMENEKHGGTFGMIKDAFASIFSKGGTTEFTKLHDTVKALNWDLHLTDEQMGTLTQTIANGEAGRSTFSATASQIGGKLREWGVDTKTLNTNSSELNELLSAFGITGYDAWKILALLRGDTDKVSSVFETLGIKVDGSKGAFGGMQEAVEKVQQSMGEKFRKFFSDTGDEAENAGESVGGFGKSIKDTSGTSILDIIKMKIIGTTMKDIGKKSDNTKTKLEAIPDVVKEISKDAKSESSNLFKSYEETFENIPKGAKNAIEIHLDELQQIGEKMVQNVDNGVTKEGKIHSPSLLMYSKGSDLGQGLINGIKAKFKDIETAAKEMCTKYKEAVEGQSKTFESIGSSIMASIKRGMTGANMNGTSNNIVSGLGLTSLNESMRLAGQGAINAFVLGMKQVHIPQLNVIFNPTVKKTGNAVTVGASPKIQLMAAGGFPDVGEMFLARERGPELIGRIGNRNAVANNSQITEGIRQAVIDGMMQVSMMGGGSTAGESTAPYVINATLYTQDNEVLARAVERGNLKRADRNVNRY